MSSQFKAMSVSFKKAISVALLSGVTTALLFSGGCSKHAQSVGATGRSFRMGFMSSAPRPDINLYLQSLSIWPLHADATIISTEVPWDSLLTGEDPVTYVADNYGELVSYCRGKNLALWVYIDPENGLKRQSDSDPLVARGKSIAQPAIQQIYRRFVFVVDSLLHPDHLGLALETNLIRLVAPDSIYQGVRKAANDVVPDLRNFDPHVALSVSVQAEVAWGMLNGPGGSAPVYAGVTPDFADFPFLQELGISSYPYLAFGAPGDVPLNYYSRLTAEHALPVFISEGGWSSMTLINPLNGSPIPNSPIQQQAFIRRQSQLLTQAHAIGVFQLTFTDLSLGAWPSSDSAGLYPFAFLGLVDSNFIPKPALTAWDSLLRQPLQQGH